jgi:hypothetical protein
VIDAPEVALFATVCYSFL